MLAAPLNTSIGEFQFLQSGPIIFDSPCRTDLKKIVLHSGYHSCERCVTRGGCSGRHVTFENINTNLRNKESFNLSEDQDHHKQTNELALEPLDIDMVV